MVDSVRGSGVFPSVTSYASFVGMLIGMLMVEDSSDHPQILRVKDKITTPLENGCE